MTTVLFGISAWFALSLLACALWAVAHAHLGVRLVVAPSAAEDPHHGRGAQLPS